MAAQTVLLFLAFESVIRGPSTDGGPMCNLRFRSSDNSSIICLQKLGACIWGKLGRL